MKSFRLSALQLTLNASVLGLLTLVGILVGIRLLETTLEVWIWILWMCALGWAWYTDLKIPYEIKLQDGDSIEFRSVLSRTVLSPREIKFIKVFPLAGGFVQVHHTKGKLLLVSHMQGFYDFVSTLKSINPSIEVK